MVVYVLTLEKRLSRLFIMHTNFSNLVLREQHNQHQPEVLSLLLAAVTGGAIGINLDNRFSLTSETNTFTVTVDNVTGSVTLPLDKEYTFESFRTELEKRINSLEDAQGRTVNGVTVSQFKVGSANFLRIETGTQGADAFLKVTGPSIWGLTNSRA